MLAEPGPLGEDGGRARILGLEEQGQPEPGLQCAARAVWGPGLEQRGAAGQACSALAGRRVGNACTAPACNMPGSSLRGWPLSCTSTKSTHILIEKTFPGSNIPVGRSLQPGDPPSPHFMDAF